MVLVVAGAMAFAVFQPFTVLPRIRPAPGYALADETGGIVTSEDGRGAITLYTFVPLDCGDTCDRVDGTMREVRDRVASEIDLGDVPFRMVTVVVDEEPTTEELATAAAHAGDTGDDWVWLGGTSAQVDNVVGLGFRQRVDEATMTPSYAIVDGSGTIRGEYRYRTLAGDADKLVNHVGILNDEITNSSGIRSFAYGAAHVFQCYP